MSEHALVYSRAATVERRFDEVARVRYQDNNTVDYVPLAEVDEKQATAEQIGEQIAQALTTPMDEHVESATAKLDDDDLVAFGLVALRDPEDSAVQSVSQRVIDPEIVRESDRDPEEVVDIIHSQLCDVWDEEVREQ